MADNTRKSSRAKSIGHYILMKTIGEGTFGKVKLGTHILTGERVAVKVLEKERIVDIADVERVAREIHILKLIRQSRHIIQLYEIIETPRQLYLIMEYACGGELFDYIVEHGRAEEKDACRFLHQILAGVERVHDMNVVHRDLKPENLLLDDRQDIKIVDFGLSNTFQDGQLLQTACGSPCYAAPEMIAGNKYHPPMVDIWSCGVILFALVCGFLPFEDQNHAELYKKILNAEYEMPNFVSREVADLISGMLTTDPTKRMTLADIRNHVWYRQMPEASLRDRADMDALDEDILDQLDSYGFPREYATKCLQTNKHNHVTTTYYLIKEKQLRADHAGCGSGITRAIADIDATCHEDVCAVPLDGPANLPVMPAAAVAAVATPSRGSRAGEAVPQGKVVASEEIEAVDDAQLDAEMHGLQAPLAMHARSATPRARRPHSARPWGQAWSGTPRSAPMSARGQPARANLRSSLLRGSRYRDYSARMPLDAPRRRPLSVDPGAAYSRRACSPWGHPDDFVEPLDFQDTPQRCGPSSARGPRHCSHDGPSRLGVPPAAWGGTVPPSARSSDDVTVSCSLPPREIVREVIKTLGSQGLSFRQTSNFVVRGQTQGVRFQGEVFQMDRGGGFALRFSRVSGDVWQYKDVCARLLTSMNL
eukprot:TRINITY_DN36031_c0_g1_i1.p1 TRINITY_DN36031_c0_g1~~TRINITY_DN36031_c0_g1_i1.p1  ORF type:complete len:650 (-),score=108.60 TRINITY_DN36031_c0_g1_i1:66-2015(-)